MGVVDTFGPSIILSTNDSVARETLTQESPWSCSSQTLFNTFWYFWLIEMGENKMALVLKVRTTFFVRQFITLSIFALDI